MWTIDDISIFHCTLEMCAVKRFSSFELFIGQLCFNFQWKQFGSCEIKINTFVEVSFQVVSMKTLTIYEEVFTWSLFVSFEL